MPNRGTLRGGAFHAPANSSNRFEPIDHAGLKSNSFERKGSWSRSNAVPWTCGLNDGLTVTMENNLCSRVRKSPCAPQGRPRTCLLGELGKARCARSRRHATTLIIGNETTIAGASMAVKKLRIRAIRRLK